jgi:hypothetical protein
MDGETKLHSFPLREKLRENLREVPARCAVETEII